MGSIGVESQFSLIFGICQHFFNKRKKRDEIRLILNFPELNDVWRNIIYHFKLLSSFDKLFSSDGTGPATKHLIHDITPDS